MVSAPLIQRRRNGLDLDGVLLDHDGLIQSLKSKRELWQQINPGKAYPGIVMVSAGETERLQDMGAIFDLARTAGFKQAVLPLIRCVKENRPVIGPLVGCIESEVLLELGDAEGAHCVQIDAHVPWGAFVRVLVRSRAHGTRPALCSQPDQDG